MQIFPIPTLKSPRLFLRMVCEGDWEQILHLRSDPQVNARVKRPLSKTKHEAIAFIKKVNENNQAGKIVYWGIVSPETDKVLGSICFWKFSDDRKTAEVGYDLSIAAQGQGFMSEAMKAVLDFGFSTLRLDTVEAYTQTNNVASTKLLSRFGFELLSERGDETNELNAVFSLNAERHSRSTMRS